MLPEVSFPQKTLVLLKALDHLHIQYHVNKHLPHREVLQARPKLYHSHIITIVYLQLQDQEKI